MMAIGIFARISTTNLRGTYELLRTEGQLRVHLGRWDGRCETICSGNPTIRLAPEPTLDEEFVDVRFGERWVATPVSSRTLKGILQATEGFVENIFLSPSLVTGDLALLQLAIKGRGVLPISFSRARHLFGDELSDW